MEELNLTPEQIAHEIELGKKSSRINELKKQLRELDYIGIKIATGRGTREEYATQIAQMTEWANEVDRLQEEVKNNLTTTQ